MSQVRKTTEVFSADVADTLLGCNIFYLIQDILLKVSLPLMRLASFIIEPSSTL